MLSEGRPGKGGVGEELMLRDDWAAIRARMPKNSVFILSDKNLAFLGSKSIWCRCSVEVKAIRVSWSPAAHIVCRKGDMKAEPRGLKWLVCFARAISSAVKFRDVSDRACSWEGKYIRTIMFMTRPRARAAQ